MENDDLHIEMRNDLKGFYSVLKSSDEHLRFVFLSGVTKFSHVSIFSDLNHLVDLSFDPRCSDICGMTQAEIEENFEPEIAEILEDTGKIRDSYLRNSGAFITAIDLPGSLLRYTILSACLIILTGMGSFSLIGMGHVRRLFW